MERGLRVPLSPHEEVSFRRVALGIWKAKLLPAGDVERLKATRKTGCGRLETGHSHYKGTRLAKGWLPMTAPYVLYCPPIAAVPGRQTAQAACLPLA